MHSRRALLGWSARLVARRQEEGEVTEFAYPCFLLGVGTQMAGGEPGGLAADVSFMVVGAVDPQVNEATGDPPATVQRRRPRTQGRP